MLLEQAILQLIFFIFIELVLMTVIAIILTIALIAIVRKNDNKNASLLDR